MNPIPVEVGAAASTDRSAQVKEHQSFRGLSVAQNLLTPFTMYTVDLDQLGLFMSDSSLEAFNMAFEALFPPHPQAWAN